MAGDSKVKILQVHPADAQQAACFGERACGLAGKVSLPSRTYYPGVPSYQVDQVYFDAATPKLEDDVPHVYVDPKGLVTVGEGCMLATVEEAKKLPFIRRDGSGKATPAEIAADYYAVKKLWIPGAGPEHQMPAAKQKKYTKIELPASEITKLMKESMMTLFAGLPGAFAPDWMWFPCEAKMGLMSMVYGLGLAGLTGSKKPKIKGYPVLMHAARQFDWQTVARHCRMEGPSENRNNFTRMLFSQAFGMQVMFGDMARMRDGDFRAIRRVQTPGSAGWTICESDSAERWVRVRSTPAILLSGKGLARRGVSSPVSSPSP
jgi:hypothetical protein